MSDLGASEPLCTRRDGRVGLVIRPRDRDLGGLTVRRVLPAAERRAIGPFVFFDHMGPALMPPGQGIQVRPHPHIGLATVTYLFEGEIIHRDSLGFVQPIRPGAVNLMTAGRGIVHSERAGKDLDRASRLHGIQTWMALPEALQECPPDFRHTPAAGLPSAEFDGAQVRLIIGEGFGLASPVTQHSPTLYAELRLRAGASLPLPSDRPELGVYVVAGEVTIGDATGAALTMLVPDAGGSLRLVARADSHIMLAGGDPLGRRRMWWNFVSTSKSRIEAAKADWREGRFAAVPGDPDGIPLPES